MSALAAVLLGVLLVALWAVDRERRRQAGRARLFAELACRQEQVGGRAPEASAPVVVAAAAQVLGASRDDSTPDAGDAELVLLAPEGALVWESDGTGGARRRPLRPAAVDPPWLLRAVGEISAVAGVEDGRPWLSAVLGPPADPLAVLRVRRPAGAPAFRRADLRLADLLAEQAADWLTDATGALPSRTSVLQGQAAERAARSLGSVSGATAPALVVLRESADRLARLAEDPSGVEHIVEELHHVETAVASLLGAVALASEPDLLHLPEPVQERGLEDASDWTTTGLLS